MAEVTMVAALNAALRDALAARSPHARVRRGRRRARRRLPRDRGPAGRVRPRARVRHADRRGRDRRDLRRARDGRVAPDRRDAVRRVLLPRARPGDQPPREVPRAHPRPGRRARRDPDPVVRRHPGQGAPRREPRDLLRPHRRAEGGGAVDAARRVPAAAALDRRPGPRDLPRAEEPLLVQGGRRPDRGGTRHRTGAGRAGGRGVRPDRVRRDGRTMPRGRDRPGRGRDRGRRPRPPIAGPARRRRRSATPSGRPDARSSCTRRRSRSGWAPRSWRGSSRRRSTTSRRRSRGSPDRTCRTRPRPSNSATSRASSGSRTPSARWSPTDGRARLRPARSRRGSRGGDRERVARRRGRHGLVEPAVRRDRDGQGDGRGARRRSPAGSRGSTSRRARRSPSGRRSRRSRSNGRRARGGRTPGSRLTATPAVPQRLGEGPRRRPVDGLGLRSGRTGHARGRRGARDASAIEPDHVDGRADVAATEDPRVAHPTGDRGSAHGGRGDPAGDHVPDGGLHGAGGRSAPTSASRRCRCSSGRSRRCAGTIRC